jgi:hypothetical protein
MTIETKAPMTHNRIVPIDPLGTARGLRIVKHLTLQTTTSEAHGPSQAPKTIRPHTDQRPPVHPASIGADVRVLGTGRHLCPPCATKRSWERGGTGPRNCRIRGHAVRWGRW